LDLPPGWAGHARPRYRWAEFLAAVPLSPGSIHPVCGRGDGTVIRPVVIWLYQRGLSQKAEVPLVYLLLLTLLTGMEYIFGMGRKLEVWHGAPSLQ